MERKKERKKQTNNKLNKEGNKQTNKSNFSYRLISFLSVSTNKKKFKSTDLFWVQDFKSRINLEIVLFEFSQEK